MGKKIPAAAVPALRLTSQDESDLQQLSELLEHELVSLFESFAFRDQRAVDAAKWKLVRSEGDIHAYKERHVAQKRARPEDPLSGLHGLAKHEPGPQQKLAEHLAQPRVLVTGTIPGTLDDAMYGCSFQDTPSFQNFWAAQGERIEESAVLAKLAGAAVDDPYRFLGVVWMLRTFPLNILQRRDLLALGSRCTTQLSNGERVGLSLGHSIAHGDLGELHEFNTIRAESSLLTLYRQFDVNRVEVFMIQVLDTKGCVPDYAHVQEAIAHLMPMTATLCDAGFRRKLEWLVKRRRHDHLDGTLGDTIEPQSSGTNDFCEVCSKKLGTFFSSPGTSCQLCYQRICSRCRVSHELFSESTRATRTKLRAQDFCVPCSLKARATPTLTVAQHHAQYGGSSSSSSSRSSVLSTSVSSTKSSVSTRARDRARTTLLSTEALKSV